MHSAGVARKTSASNVSDEFIASTQFSCPARMMPAEASGLDGVSSKYRPELAIAAMGISSIVGLASCSSQMHNQPTDPGCMMHSRVSGDPLHMQVPAGGS